LLASPFKIVVLMDGTVVRQLCLSPTHDDQKMRTAMHALTPMTDPLRLAKHRHFTHWYRDMC
jgi:hypothetical protein